MLQLAVVFCFLCTFLTVQLNVLQLELAEACLKNAMDLSGLLLLYSSLGDAEGILELASLAKENGKNNVAFLCLFMLGKLEECLQLLIERWYFSLVPLFHHSMSPAVMFGSNRDDYECNLHAAIGYLRLL